MSSAAPPLRRLLHSSTRQLHRQSAAVSASAPATSTSTSAASTYLPTSPGLPRGPVVSKRQDVHRRLARIEATHGVVSPFLTDTFGREHDYLRISLTEKCNLRCTYCMPEEGAPLSPKEHLLSTDEIIRIASIFVSQGVRKIRLTGGEPTVRKDLPEIVERLSGLGIQSLGMTSNGIALSRKLPGLVKAGLTNLNISLDTLDPHKFELMTRRRGHAAVLSAIKQASQFLPPSTDPSLPHLKGLKLNVVVINNLNTDEIASFVELTRELPLEIRFIEYMPFDGNKWSTKKLVPSAQLLSQITAAYPHPGQELEAITPNPSDTARIYRVKGYKGSFGFISSMTDHFCSGCSRLRLGADGSIKVCLFGEPTLSLRDMIRGGASDQDVQRAIGGAVKNKHFAHDGKSGPSDLAANAKSPMVLIVGGGEGRTDTTFPTVHRNAPSTRIFTRPHSAKSIPRSLLPFYSMQPSTFSIGTRSVSYSTSRAFRTFGNRAAPSLAASQLQRTRETVLSTLSTATPFLISSSRSFSSSLTPRDDDPSSTLPKLTHISSETGKPTMVSITSKSSTSRSATAIGRVRIPRMAYDMLLSSPEGRSSAKGDVLTVAQLAGIMGAKRTSDLIPLCHPINLTNVNVKLEVKQGNLSSSTSESAGSTGGKVYWIQVEAIAECTGSTGVEMEALAAVNVACLTVWDMLKAVAGKEMVVEGIKVVRKSGGKSGDWEREEDDALYL